MAEFYKKNDGDKIWWLDEPEGKLDHHIFSFDKVHTFDLFFDYPHKLSKKQKELFDKENPKWKAFFEGK